MVLPTRRHAPLTAWLNARERNCASELAGKVLLRGYGPLKQFINPLHLTPDVDELFRFARSAPPMFSPLPKAVHAAREILRGPVTSALVSICDDLEALGIEALPYNGLGVLSGDEIFDCVILINNPLRLAELLGVSYALDSAD